MAAAMCQALPSFYSDYCKKLLFISVSCDFYEKHIVTQDYCVSTHNSLCSLENCKFHLVLIGISFSQIFQRLDKYVYIYQEIDCLYTLFKHRFYSSIVTSSGEMFIQLRRAVQHNLRRRGAKKMPSIAKKRLFRKNSGDIIYVPTRNWLPHKLLVQRFWIEFEKIITQNMNLICSRLLIALLIVIA